MNEDELLFEKGCFLANWIDDSNVQELSPFEKISRTHNLQQKDLATLLSELDDIKERINEVRERKWQLAKLEYFHQNNFS